MEKKKNQGFTTGMSHFYRKLLEESEVKHEATVAATSNNPKVIGPQGPNLTITKPPEMAAKTDKELALQAKEQGKDIELNDDNQIVDKRELLSAGLNLAMANTRKLGLKKLTAESKETAEVAAHRAVGTAASKKDIDRRRAREIEVQMQEEKERLTREKERREKEALERVVQKRNTDNDVESARERYLARKRRKLEEAESIPSGGDMDVDPS
jgi:coiled-coil domain-containing protein 55